MKEFHCVVGNKGGVGKSWVASLVMQYAEDQGWGPFGIECDQSNRTLTRYDRLRTKRIELLDRDQQIVKFQIESDPFVIPAVEDGQGGLNDPRRTRDPSEEAHP